MINREATIRWKGYDPDDLKPKSSKRVWANCDECGKGRWVYRYGYRDLCGICSRAIREIPKKHKFVSEEDRFIIGTGIDRITTIQETGYDPADLTHGSVRQVWANCKDCGHGRWVCYQDYRDLCSICGHKSNPNHPLNNREFSDEHKQKLRGSHPDQSGENNPNYIDGRQIKHDQWVLDVKKRDNNVCAICNDLNKRPNAHHIFNQEEYYDDEDRFGLWNGITLCGSCHRKAHGSDKEYYQDWFVFINLERLNYVKE